MTKAGSRSTVLEPLTAHDYNIHIMYQYIKKFAKTKRLLFHETFYIQCSLWSRSICSFCLLVNPKFHYARIGEGSQLLPSLWAAHWQSLANPSKWRKVRNSSRYFKQILQSKYQRNIYAEKWEIRAYTWNKSYSAQSTTPEVMGSSRLCMRSSSHWQVTAQ